MKKAAIRYTVFIAMAALLALAAGCGTSASSRFYRMYPSAQEGSKAAPAAAASAYVSIGPVDVPAYLQRPQIATRMTGNELEYAEYDRWAGPLRDNIAAVLVEDVSASLAGEGVSVRPWDIRVSPDYQVEVGVREFEGYPGRSVRLNAAWSVIGSGGKVLATKRSVIDKDISGTGYAAYVDAMNGALAELSREIADAIRALRAGR